MTGVEDKKSQGRNLAGFRVLIVEDEFLIATAIERVLTELSCEVLGPAPRLAKAIQLANEEAFDAAILDINVDGQKVDPLARELRDRGLPIILVTGYGKSSIAEDLRSLPVVGKPFKAERLQQMVLDVFRGKQPLAHGGRRNQ